MTFRIYEECPNIETRGTLMVSARLRSIIPSALSLDLIRVRAEMSADVRCRTAARFIVTPTAGLPAISRRVLLLPSAHAW
jgi:hypothetical protein